ncbi:MAG UNVERIFIED_CONTAM: hypothetical protein LVR18_22120 [Planctomycetaceae bacterium]
MSPGRSPCTPTFSWLAHSLVKAAAIDVYDQVLVVRGPQQKLRFEATGPITFGRVGELDGQRRQLGAVIGASGPWKSSPVVPSLSAPDRFCILRKPVPP